LSIECVQGPCGGGLDCCVVSTDAGPDLQCLNGCPNGEQPITCEKPSDCGAGTVCCATLALGPGQIPACSLQGAWTSCQASCTTQLQPSCSVDDTARLCGQASDCDPAEPYCCTLPFGKYNPYVCVDGFMKSLLGLTCK
jgi:hypothetical protein